VTGCAVTATVGGAGNTNDPLATPEAGMATVIASFGTAVNVRTSDASGNPADRSFHLVVMCS
jgi:hypothetical protein